MFSLLLNLLSISQNISYNDTYNISQSYKLSSGCGNNPSDVIFINSHNDINIIKDCNLINGSLFINGDYNIYSLKNLSNLEFITGYLVIYDSHTLKSLNGLHNLKYIYSQNPYLQDYGVTIKYNDNSGDNKTGLCFGDKVDWNILTPINTNINNNRIDCPNCHSECNGCFGPSRFLCQECNNYKSGDACVSICPNGTLLSNNICNEFYPNETINLNFNRINNENKLNISWKQPNNPNGYITQYILFRDNNKLLDSYYNIDGYYTNDYLSNQYIDTLEDLDTIYKYKIAYANSIGSFISNTQDYLMINRIPHDINNLEYRNLTNSSVILNWFYNNSLLFPKFEYSFNNSVYFNILNLTTYNNFYTFCLENLYSDQHYNISIRARYNNNFIGRETTISLKTLDNNYIQYIPETDNNIIYWYFILIGCLFLVLILYFMFCYSPTNNNSQNETNTNPENITRIFDNPIYEIEESKYGDVSTYGDVFLNQRSVIVNSNYNYINNDTVESNSLDFSLPKRKITKRRSSGKLYNSLEKKENLIEELREKVPDMVPKNMLKN